MGAALGPNVVAPPPSTGISGGTGTRSLSSSSAPTLGTPSIVPPPPSLSGAGGGTGSHSGGAGTPRGTLLANNIVPPPPSVGGRFWLRWLRPESQRRRSGRTAGRRLTLAPPTSGGSGANAGAVISSQPGPKVGLPSSGGTGSLAMSPSGGDKPGLGGAGGGTSIGRGNGPGSGMNGAGSGAGKAATGRGSDPTRGGGISPAAGPGGAGNAPSGTPPVRGVDISGGTGIVTLPRLWLGFLGQRPRTPGRSAVKQRQALGVTVVATATSGGAFEPYKNLLRGEKYTTYFDTSLGTVVMEFADEGCSRPSLRRHPRRPSRRFAPILRPACRAPAWWSPAPSTLPAT